MQFAHVAALARLLSPDDFGLAAAVLVVVGFANAFSDMCVTVAVSAPARRHHIGEFEEIEFGVEPAGLAVVS